MDSDKRSAQVERLEVVDTGRRRRWSEDEKLKIVLESLQAPRQVARRQGDMAFRAHCCSDGDARLAPSRRMPPSNKWAHSVVSLLCTIGQLLGGIADSRKPSALYSYGFTASTGNQSLVIRRPLNR